MTADHTESCERNLRASVVIPANDEENNIPRTLDALLEHAEPRGFRVVAICNGSQDGTTERARGFPGVIVRELFGASNSSAQREDDRIATVFPRTYMDTDVPLDTTMARELSNAVVGPVAMVARARGWFDVARADQSAKLFLEVPERLPVLENGIIGGAYTRNEAARRRLEEWPDVIADDQLVLRLFSGSERATLRRRNAVIAALASIPAAIRRGVRVRRGNRQVTGMMEHGFALPKPRAGLRHAIARSMTSVRGLASMAAFAIGSVAVRVVDGLGWRGDWGSHATPKSS